MAYSGSRIPLVRALIGGRPRWLKGSFAWTSALPPRSGASCRLGAGGRRLRRPAPPRVGLRTRSPAHRRPMLQLSRARFRGPHGSGMLRWRRHAARPGAFGDRGRRTLGHRPATRGRPACVARPRPRPRPSKGPGSTGSWGRPDQGFDRIRGRPRSEGERTRVKIAIGSDHAGFRLKAHFKDVLGARRAPGHRRRDGLRGAGGLPDLLLGRGARGGRGPGRARDRPGRERPG